jgi:hypothetical protein
VKLFKQVETKTMKKARGLNGLERNCRYFELDFEMAPEHGRA